MSISQETLECKVCHAKVVCGSSSLRVRHPKEDADQTWTIKPGFFAKCHNAGSGGRGSPFGCAICEGSYEAYRSRNELWAHLESHGVDDLENEPDIIQTDYDL